ncbi:hypothetical protein [Burkholderia gladioli]|uniref:hypothetical protein n=1 Tax=Burkholderia gladioli TaxID=28095 RepID=UPI0016425BF6|nr:hypothetical protein [Burkholderia gladioli]
MKDLTDQELAQLEAIRHRAHRTNIDLDRAMALLSTKGAQNAEAVRKYERAYDAHQQALGEFKALVGHEKIGPQS